MRILVTGGRNYKDTTKVSEVLNEYSVDVLIQGGARGADTLAYEWAVQTGIECETYWADWDKEGKSAGYIRNVRMAVEGKPDLVIAFPGGKGTANMVKIAKEKNIPVRIVE